MKKCILWIVAVTAAVAVLSCSAVTQPPETARRETSALPRGGPGGMSVTQLLRHEEVIKMLEITEEQSSELATVLRSTSTQPQSEQEQSTQGQGSQSRAPARTTLTVAEMRARSDELWNNIGNILKEEQLAKLKEIYFQAAGGLESTVLDARLLDAMNLTDDQAKQVNEIADSRTEANRVLAQGRRQSVSEYTPEEWITIVERNRKCASQIKALLTEEQKKKAEELTAGATALREKLGFRPQE